MIPTLSVSFVDLDYRIFTFLNGLGGHSQVWDFIYVALAEYVMFLMIGGLALFVVLKKENKRWIVSLQALTAAFIGRALIISLIRAFFFRARPFVDGVVTQLVAHNPAEASFPSGHTTVMFAIAFSLFYVNKKWAIIYLILATVSAISRVIVGVHFPMDIAGGILVGLLSALISKAVFDFWIKRRG
ncbi:MAG: phosphatase PAP2 family protein [Patescibacteria group bacterium]